MRRLAAANRRESRKREGKPSHSKKTNTFALAEMMIMAFIFSGSVCSRFLDVLHSWLPVCKEFHRISRLDINSLVLV